jgi:hypothetical protein
MRRVACVSYEAECVRTQVVLESVIPRTLPIRHPGGRGLRLRRTLAAGRTSDCRHQCSPRQIACQANRQVRLFNRSGARRNQAGVLAVPGEH